jgi:hypothetical protein
VVIKKKKKKRKIGIQLSETCESITISKKKNIIISKSNVLFIKKKKTSNKLKLSLQNDHVFGEAL